MKTDSNLVTDIENKNIGLVYSPLLPLEIFTCVIHDQDFDLTSNLGNWRKSIQSSNS